MTSLFAQPGNGMLFLGGQKISGQDIRDQNGWLPN
jgi:T-complex protein 1 subunit alpha